jgi:hypothetical protein
VLDATAFTRAAFRALARARRDQVEVFRGAREGSREAAGSQPILSTCAPRERNRCKRNDCRRARVWTTRIVRVAPAMARDVE